MRILKAVFFILLALHVVLLFLGIASVITMFLFYCTAAWAGVRLIQYLNGRFISEKPAQNIKVLVISATFALITAELFLRYVKQDFTTYSELNGEFIYFSENIQQRNLNRIKKLLPSSDTSWFHTNRINYHLNDEFNSLGLREAELKSYSNNEKNLVIGLGDSFTEGVGASYDSVWLRQMAQILKDKGYDLKILNAGVAGSDPLFGYMLLQYKLSHLNPKLVIVAINNSDLIDIIRRGGFERFGDNFSLKYKSPNWWEYFYSFSFIVRNVVHGIYKMDWVFLTPKQKEEAEAKAKAVIIECIRKFKDYAAERNFNLLLVFHPMSNEIQNHSFKLEDVCHKVDSLKIPYVNLYSYYIEHGMNQENVYDYYWKTELHHNSQGYGLWARAVAEKIVSDRLID